MTTAETARPLNLPTGWTFAALAAGLALGWLLAGGPAIEPLLAVAEPVGTLWLRALQMTIIPLVAALLVTGIARMVATARAGAMARRTLGWFIAVLACGTLLAAVATPANRSSCPTNSEIARTSRAILRCMSPSGYGPRCAVARPAARSEAGPCGPASRREDELGR